MINERDAALFSYLAYDPPNTNKVEVPAGWVQLDEYNDHDDPGSGFGVRVFRNTATGELVVAYRGSAAFSPVDPDWIPTNAALSTGQYARQLEQALEVVADLQRDGVAISKMTFAGHSLGGGLAGIVAVFFDRPALTFAAAPFELSARDDRQLQFQHDVAAYYSGYMTYLGEDGPAPHAAFTGYKDAWSSGDVAGRALLLQRERAVLDWYVSFDPVRALDGSPLAPMTTAIAGHRKELEIGSQSVVWPSPQRHDMRFIAALMASESFRLVHHQHPSLLEQLGDESLYGRPWDDSQVTSFMVQLLRGAYSSNPSERGLIDRFAADIGRIPSGTAASPFLKEALIALAIEFYKYADPSVAGNFFGLVDGALRFNLQQIPTWDPSGPGSAAIVDTRSGRGLARLFEALPFAESRGFIDVDAVASRSPVWTIKAGFGGLLTSGMDASEVQVGGSMSPNSLRGGGGDDVLYGGTSVDMLEGGDGNDVLIGDGRLTELINGNSDRLSGGAGVDYLLGGDGQDFLDGGEDNDVLVGGEGGDQLQGGAGFDTYIYDSGDGADRILGGDTDGVIIFDGVALNVVAAVPVADHVNTWFSVVGGAPFYFHLTDSNELRISKVLADVTDTIFSSADKRLTIEDFCSGDLGINLPTAIRGNSTILERGAQTYSISTAVRAGSSIRVSVGAQWREHFQLVTGAETLVFDAGGSVEIAIAEGQNRFVYSLVSVGDVDQDGQVNLSATLLDANGISIGNPSLLEIDYVATVESADSAPVTTYTVQGDRAPLLDGNGELVYDTWGNIVPIGPAPDRDDDLFGTTASDHIITGGGINHVQAGQGGSDLITGGSGIDGVLAGAGNDFLIGAGGGDRLSGGAGDDRIFGESEITIDAAILAGQTDTGNSAFHDFLRGADGADMLIGSAGRDVLSGGAGDDTLIAGAGDDHILGDTDRMAVWQRTPGGVLPWEVIETAAPGAGGTIYTYTVTNSNLIGSSQPDGNDLIHAGAGNDSVMAGGGDDLIFGESGDDKIFAGAGDDTVLGGDGEDSLVGDEAEGEGGRDFLDGGGGNDTIVGANGDDTLFGGAGNDLISGDQGTEFDGADYLNGEDGDDTLWGGGRDDILVGGEGNDILYGDDEDTSSNTLSGNDGNDYLDGGSGGTDSLIGGAGDDTYVWRSSGVTITELADEGTDTVRSSVAHTLGADIENLVMTNTSTTNITSNGNAANNVMTGGSGRNTLNGNEGDDTLNGMGGTDTLNGGLGADVYQYAAGSGADTINNVSADSLIDRLQLLDLAADQITFSKSGNNLVMTQLGATTNTVTVTNWFTATANRVDFVNFTNVEKTADDIDALFANGGTGGMFTQGGGSQAMMAALFASEAPAATSGGKGGAVYWRPIKEFESYTLADSEAGIDKGNPLFRQFEPIKNFTSPERVSTQSMAADSAFERLVSAIAGFGEGRSANVIEAAEQDSFASQVSVSLAQADVQRRPSPFASEFRSVLD